MSKFRVSFHGSNYRIGIIEKKFFFRRTSVFKSVGFYATRFVEAETANKAVEEVLAALRIELEEDDRTTPNSKLELEEIRVDEAGFEQHAPGAGYTFYEEASHTPDSIRWR